MINIENETSVESLSVQARHKLLHLTEDLKHRNPDTRAAAAELVRQHGYAAYVGGRHVAIHRATRTGSIKPGRLALITSDAPDFV